MWGKWEWIWNNNNSAGTRLGVWREGFVRRKGEKEDLSAFHSVKFHKGPPESAVMAEASICLASVPQSLSPTASEPGLPKAHITYSFLPSLSAAATACVLHTPGRCATQSKCSETHSTSCLSASNTNTHACTPNIIPQARHITAY